MIKIRVSYTNTEDMPRLLAALKGFKIVHISKPYDKKNRKNVYLELEQFTTKQRFFYMEAP